jgi:hypothetical protein
MFFCKMTLKMKQTEPTLQRLDKMHRVVSLVVGLTETRHSSLGSVAYGNDRQTKEKRA